MDRSEAFPLLQPSDLLKHCRLSLSMTDVTEEQILRPTAESARSIYGQFLHIALRYSPPNRDLPEMQESSVPLVLLFRKIRAITPVLGCKQDFRLTDVLTPEPRRTRHFFSAFINFIKFRTDEEIFSEHLNKERECGVFQEEYEKVRNELETVRGDIEKMTEKKEAARLVVTGMESRIKELTAAKANAESIHLALANDILRLSQEDESAQEITSQIQRRVADLETQLAALERKVTSPTEAKAALRRATETLENEQFRDMDIEQKFKEIARRTKMCLDVQAEVQTAKSELEVLACFRSQWLETKERVKAKEEGMRGLVRTLELQRMKVAAAQRVQVTVSEQMQRDWEVAEARLQGLGTLGKAKKEEVMQARGELQCKMEESARAKQTIEELERRSREEEENYQTAFNHCVDALNALKTAFEDHCCRLQQTIEKAKSQLRDL